MINKIRNCFKDKDFIKKLIVIALPLAFQELMLASVAAGDAFMLGMLDQNSMSAVSLASQIQFIQNMLLFGLISGFSVLSAQYWGSKSIRSVKKLLAIALLLTGFVSIAAWAGCTFCPEKLMSIYTNIPELNAIGCRYLKITAWSYLISFLIECHLSLMKVTGKPHISALVSSCTVVLNIILNAILIFGLFGLPKLGVEGAAIATLISRIIELIVSILLSFKKDYIRPKIKYFFSIDRVMLKSYAITTLPLLGAYVLWGCGFSTFTSCIGHLGEDAAAANAITAVIRDLMCCMCNGIAVGGAIFLGNELGAGKLEEGKKHGQHLLILSFICGFICTALILLSIPLLSNFIILSDYAKQLFYGMMVIMAFYMISRCANTVLINGVFSSGGDTYFDLYSICASMYGVAIPLSLLGTYLFNWPVHLVYLFTCIDEIGKVPWVLYHFKKYKWVRDITIASEKVHREQDPLNN